MNEITFTGNVSKIHDRRITASRVTIFSFDLAVDNGYFDRNRNTSALPARSVVLGCAVS